jgi:hypothetical protein
LPELLPLHFRLLLLSSILSRLSPLRQSNLLGWGLLDVYFAKHAKRWCFSKQALPKGA